jgi:hypothetical protein
MRSAYHESGHVLVAMRWLGQTARMVSIVAPRAGSFGQARIEVAAILPTSLTTVERRRIRVPEAAMFLGGLAAEEVAGFGRSSGVGDLEAIARLRGPEALAAAWASVLRPVPEAEDDIEGAAAAVMEAFPTTRDPLARLLRLYAFVVRFLAAARSALDRLAHELQREGLLTAEQVERVVGGDLTVRR